MASIESASPNEPPRGRDAIVIGASAGGVEAMIELARHLPAGLAAAVFVVIHTSPTAPGFLSGMIGRAGPLVAEYARDGVVALPGHIYIAPGAHHLLVEPGGRMRVWRGPKENGFRPAIDPLFRSAARAYGPRAIGVILSGYLDDGTLGLMLIKRRGGVAVAQDPATAACPDMPRAAIKNVDVDYGVPLEQMPALLERLVKDPSPAGRPGVTAMPADIRSGSEDGPIQTTPNPIDRKEAAPRCCATCWCTTASAG